MLARFTSWIADTALPLWRERGVDARLGLFHERLSFGGAPLPVPYRAMVQARQIYVFSHAAALGLANAADQAERAMAELVRRYADHTDEGTSLAFSIDPASGDVVSAVRDSYTHAFVLLAAAFLHRVTGDPALVALADDVTRFIENRMTAPEGGVVDALPSAAGAAKRQNPQMHLLEAYLALEETVPGRGYLERGLALVALFRQRLFDRRSGVLLEHFAADWRAHPDPGLAAIFEPGHHYEWVWLLEQVERLSGGDLAEERMLLWKAAQQDGHAADGLIYDEVGTDHIVVKRSHRLWPHTEAIKAAATRHRTDDVDARGFGDRMAGALIDRFLDRPFAGGWIDQFEPDGTPKVDYVPASSLYHLFLAGAEAAAAFTPQASDLTALSRP